MSQIIMTDAETRNNSRESTGETDMAQYLSYHSTPMVEVVVGEQPEQRTFHIHAGHLIEYSGFFEAALQPYFTSGEQKKVCLPDESVEDFSTFARFVYDPDDLNFGDYHHYAKVYVLAERLLVPILKEEMLLAFKKDLEHDLLALVSLSRHYQQEDAEEVWRPLEMEDVIELAKIVYAGTSRPDDGLRNLLAVYVASAMHERKDCRHCQNGRMRRMRVWDAASTWELLKCGLDEFLFDVMVSIPVVCDSSAV